MYLGIKWFLSTGFSSGSVSHMLQSALFCNRIFPMIPARFPPCTANHWIRIVGYQSKRSFDLPTTMSQRPCRRRTSRHAKDSYLKSIWRFPDPKMVLDMMYSCALLFLNQCSIFYPAPSMRIFLLYSWFSGKRRSIWKVTTTIGDALMFHWTMKDGPLLVINGVMSYAPYKWPYKWVTGNPYNWSYDPTWPYLSLGGRVHPLIFTFFFTPKSPSASVWFTNAFPRINKFTSGRTQRYWTGGRLHWFFLQKNA